MLFETFSLSEMCSKVLTSAAMSTSMCLSAQMSFKTHNYQKNPFINKFFFVL